jgi:hypothetical protein
MTYIGGATLKLNVLDSTGANQMAVMDAWDPGTVLTLTEGAHVATFTITRVAPSGTNRNISGTWAGTAASQFTVGQLITVSVGAPAATKVQKVHAGGNAAAAKILAGSVAARKIYAGSTLVWEA